MRPTTQNIVLTGVCTNNLKSIDAQFPIGKITVVTGVSGSGKSSLVFDSLYAESYRRYVESLSSFARQYLKALPKPLIGGVDNLPPAVAINQAQLGGNSRSTVGTVTEINDLLRVLFTHVSEIRCRTCEELVIKDTGETGAKRVYSALQGQKITITAPLGRWGKVTAKELKRQLEAQGFVRALMAGEVVRLADLPAVQLKTADVAIDRLVVDEEHYRRLVDGIEVALRVGRGRAAIYAAEKVALRLSSDLSCPNGHGAYHDPTPALFSFNHPLGACPRCQGFGFEPKIDWEKVIPDHSQSLVTQGIKPWNFGSHDDMYELAKRSALKRRLKVATPFSDYSAEDWQWLKSGVEGEDFFGVEGYFEWLESKKHKAHYRIHAARFRRYEICSACGGSRLREEALACRVIGLNVADVCRLTFTDLSSWLESVGARLAAQGRISSDATPWGLMGVKESLAELQVRVNYLNRIGVAYLNAERQTRTLSGGEMQRIKMARCLGSALTDTLYCLDEPSSGLHARDSQNLLAVIRELRDQGNTVVLVEHEKGLISGADHLMEIGPEAGHKGGHVVFVGDPVHAPDSDTVAWPRRSHKQFLPVDFMEIRGAATHNLKGFDVRIPRAAMTVVCGVSGSGKTSLIQHTFYPLVARELGQTKLDGIIANPVAKGLAGKRAIGQHSQVVLVSQASIGRSSRSNIATYLGLFNGIRKLLALQPVAQAHRLTAGSFSFNTAGGRCEHCRGLGTVAEDLSFLGEMEVICPVCQGRRFEAKVLEVLFRGKNLLDILRMTVDEAREFFFDHAELVREFDNIRTMGLGYITLGQNTSSFSGGEAQRVKLARLLSEAAGDRPAILIFDEPSTGLSDRDVRKLVQQLHHLADRGHTVLVVEHHLGMVQSADWVIEIGPEAGIDGGELVYCGVPENLRGCGRSITAKYLPKEA